MNSSHRLTNTCKKKKKEGKTQTRNAQSKPTLNRMSLPTNRNPQKFEAGKNYSFFEVQEIYGVRITDVA